MFHVFWQTDLINKLYIFCLRRKFLNKHNHLWFSAFHMITNTGKLEKKRAREIGDIIHCFCQHRTQTSDCIDIEKI